MTPSENPLAFPLTALAVAVDGGLFGSNTTQIKHAGYVAAAPGTSLCVWLAAHREHRKSIEGISCGMALTYSSVGLSSSGTNW